MMDRSYRPYRDSPQSLDTPLSRTSRNQEGRASPSAVRAMLDDPPIHIRPIVPASAGAKGENPVGSSHYGAPTIAPRLLGRKGFLCRKRQESGDKGLKPPVSGMDNARHLFYR
jgi:hypothetical protein